MRAIVSICCIVFLAAAPIAAYEGTRIDVPTRPGVTVPVYLLLKNGAAATLALLPGGNGAIGRKDEEPSSSDFLVRMREEFLRRGFNVAVVGRPTDIADLDLPKRRGPDHLTDLHRVVERLKADTAVPVWLVGMSRGTVSAAAAAIAFGSEDLAGIVLVSSITSTAMPYTVPRLRLERVQVPVLLVHHEKDACKIADPDGVDDILLSLTNAPVAKAVLMKGGWGAWGDPCTSSSWHGYSGVEKKAVDLISGWIRQPEP